MTSFVSISKTNMCWTLSDNCAIAGVGKITAHNAGGGLSYEEMNRLKLIPGGQSVFYQSSDELSGKLDGVPFRAVNVCTGEKVSARSSTPKILFEGQVIK